MKISLDEQITAVETEYVNLRGSIEIVEELVKRGKRNESELQIKKARLVNLEAAIKSLKWLRANSDRIKSSLAQGLPSAD